MGGKFLYGAATSAYQVEGNNIHSDWWDWEKRTPGVTRSGKAADHWNRYKEDFALAKSLGHNAHRLSIEWSRIEPTPGVWNMKAVEHYRNVLRELKQQGFTTFVTLHHFTNPQWFAERGGWVKRANVAYFTRYVRFISQRIGEDVDFWVTINEPMVYSTISYWAKHWPPQEKNFLHMLRVIWNMAQAHKKAYRILHTMFPKTPVGIAKHCIAYIPEHKHELDDTTVTSLQDWWFNHMFLWLTGKATHDYIGVNYYFPRHHHITTFPPSMKLIDMHKPTTDLGWVIDATGLTHVLLHMKKYGKPIYITENGLADKEDTRRADFIRSHLRAIEAAQAKGVDVRGYLHWSLMDNFEWAEGFAPRFGLIEVDYVTQQRTVRPSARVYQAIIEQASRNT